MKRHPAVSHEILSCLPDTDAELHRIPRAREDVIQTERLTKARSGEDRKVEQTKARDALYDMHRGGEIERRDAGSRAGRTELA
jgi:hypothetical protein